MTGPEHYRASEALLDNLRPDSRAKPMDLEIAKAPLHATLALAASLGLSAHLPMPDQEAWRQAAGSAITV